MLIVATGRPFGVNVLFRLTCGVMMLLLILGIILMGSLVDDAQFLRYEAEAMAIPFCPVLICHVLFCSVLICQDMYGFALFFPCRLHSPFLFCPACLHAAFHHMNTSAMEELYVLDDMFTNIVLSGRYDTYTNNLHWLVYGLFYGFNIFR